ncbi:MAG TPA: hypothetical protein VNG69_07665 [Casimicrobiaceae bacterium]|nr:hypothetical protein [Casimicrobiaceae bacterium]
MSSYPMADVADEPAAPFGSFWMAGFEGADHVNTHGVAVDMGALTGHARQYRGDYRRVRALGMRTVRESVGWRVSTHGRGFDFSRAILYAKEARRQRIDVVWSLWHFGIPADVDPFDERSHDRFARFCSEAASALEPYVEADCWFNPVNEISFLCWLLTHGRTGAAWTGEKALEAARLKRGMCRAAVLGTAAIAERIPGARFLHTDPMIHAVAGDDAPEHIDEVQAQLRAQYDAWDMLCDPAFESRFPVESRVHMLGLNHYHSSQWVVPSQKPLRWHLRDPRRRPLSSLTAELHARYRLPFMIAETSHFGSGRADWLRDIIGEIRAMQSQRQPVAGACVYPFIDRPDWDRPNEWHHSGVCDVVPCDVPSGGKRVVNRSYARALAAAPSRSSNERAAPCAERIPMDSLIVFTHLRWDSVWQRPQHLITRFARRFNVVVIEEPCFEEGPPRLEIVSPVDGITLLRAHTSVKSGGFHDDQIPAIRPMIEQALRARGIVRYGIYTFTPMALPLMQGLAPEAVAYDCMDELSAFRFAPRQLPQRESALFRIADVVFTGGPSLYRSKRALHDDVHCFPSSVDAAHFATARRGAHVHADIARVRRPRLGFYGVIDERFDVELVRAVAAAKPDWHWFYVGPVVKIDAATLPRAPNLHWMPQQPYEALPSLIAGWDVCLLPFARNEHTRYISPTKTLEYLAADKPIVSTSIVDVVDLYGDVVGVGDDAVSFIAACESALLETAAARTLRSERARRHVEQTSWDATANAMADLIVAVSAKGLRDEAKTRLSGAPSRRTHGKAVACRDAAHVAASLAAGTRSDARIA